MSVKLAVGDVAKLKSDGPWMTVVKDRTEAGSKFVVAAWFDGSSLHQESFPRDALEPHPSVVAAKEAAKKDKAEKSEE